MTHDGLEKVFPAYHKKFNLPEQAREQELQVYRACKTGKIEQDSFQDSYTEEGGTTPNGMETHPSAFSLSTYTNVKDLRRFCAINAKYQPPFLLAKGTTAGCCGVCCMTSEWDVPQEGFPFRNKKKKSTHVDRWLYSGAMPWEHFEEANYETETELFQ